VQTNFEISIALERHLKRIIRRHSEEKRGMVSVGPVQFGYEDGLYAFLGVVLFLLLYLVRPRVLQLKVPSLSFFMKGTFKSPLISFLRRVLQDLLTLFQFLAIVLLAASVAEPYLLVSHEVTGQATVLVLDVSGSSQARDGGTSRFAAMKSKAFDVVGRKNTIILAKDVSSVVLSDGSADEARTVIDGLQPTASATRLGDAILLAGELLAGKEGRVVVISDFIATVGTDPAMAKTVVESKGVVVDFFPLAGKNLPNVGFVDSVLGDATTQVSIKNYDVESRNVIVKAGATTDSLAIPAQSVKTFTFPTPPGTTKVELDGANDALDVDNIYYLSAPKFQNVKVLYISNNASLFLQGALKANPGVEIQVAVPPIVPQGKFDVYVIDNVLGSQVLPGTFEEILQQVRAGSQVIIIGQPDAGGIDYKGLLPVTITGTGEATGLNVDIISKQTRNIDFGRVTSYLTTTLRPGATAYVSAGTSPIIAQAGEGAGHLLYYGLMERASDFRFSPYFPIFWSEVLNGMLGRDDIMELNARVDESITFPGEVNIKTPRGDTIKTTSYTFEYPGFYQLNDRVIAVSMLNERESNLNPKAAASSQKEYKLTTIIEDRPLHLELFALALVIVLFFLEIMIVKGRGDL